MNPTEDSNGAVVSSTNDPAATHPTNTGMPAIVQDNTNQTQSLQPIPLPMPEPPINPETAVLTPSQTPTFQVADDKDIIEPEWVHKAQSIVLQYREDPYTQSEQLTAFKAEYMQKRYNKVIKLK